MSVLQAGLLNQSSAQVIDGSLKFDNSAYLKRTPSSAGNRRTWTWSAWYKSSQKTGTNRYLFAAGYNTTPWYGWIHQLADNSEFQVTYDAGVAAGFKTTPRYRDTGWYHVVWSHDSTQSTNTGKTKIYVNGVQVTDFDNTSYPSLNEQGPVNNTVLHELGGKADRDPLLGRLSQVYLIDGQALGPEYFGFTDPLTNTWRPKKFSGNYTLSTINDGTVWSGGTYTGTTPNSGYGVAEAFNGVGYPGLGFGSGVQWGFYPGTATLTLPKAITFTSDSDTFEIYSYHTSGSTGSITFTCSNGSVAPTLSTNATNIIGSTTVSNPYSTFGSEITAITLVSSGSDWTAIAGIVVNGVVMVDGKNGEGINSFYLPMDGNSPIGQDKSGQGNDWTPVNFGGSVALDNPIASGALPILNTTQGGTQAGVGVRTDTTATSINSGQTWSSGSTVTGGTLNNAGQGFDGSIASSGYAELVATDTSTTANVTFTASIPNVTKVEVFVHSSSSSGDTRGTCLDTDGVTHTSATLTSSSQSFHTIYEGPPITLANVGWGINQNGQTGTNSDGFRAFRVNGYILKDSTSSGEGLVLALPLVGTANDVSNQINSGSSTKTVTAVGNAAASSAQSNFYSGSFVYDGSGDALKSTTSGLAPGTSDFCCEGWFYFNSLSSAFRLLGNVNNNANTTDWQLIYQSNGTLTIWNNSSYASVGTAPFTTGKWHHVAYVRDGDTHKAYVDGVQMSTTITRTGNNFTYNGLDIGGRNDGAECINGYVQDVRFYIGTAKYTSNFILASTSPDILPDTPSGVAGGSKLTKITDGAVSVTNAGNSYLSAGGESEDYNFGTGDFTIEGYFYINSSGGNNCVFDLRDSGSSSQYFMRMTSSTAYDFRYSGSSLGTFTAADKVWNHIAISRASGTTKIFVNGIQTNSFADTNNASNTGPLLISTFNDTTGSSSSYGFTGFISNLRVIKGTALYTSNFTPPTAPLTNVTNTKLLCCQSNAQAGAAVTAPNMGGINNGTQWSSYLTVSDSFTSSGRAAGFDGSTGTYSQPNTNSSSITWAPSGGITYSTSVEVYTYQSNGVFTTVSDGAQSVSWTTLYQGWKTIASGGGTFTSTTLTSGNPSASDSRPTFAAVRVDGTILVDPLSPYGDVAATNFNPFNTDINTVRGQETGYATLNPLDKTSSTVLSAGNLTYSSSSSTVSNARSTLSFPSSGKYYFESTNITQSQGYPAAGIARNDVNVSGGYNVTGSMVVRNIASQSRRAGFEYDGNNHINMTPSATPLEPGDTLQFLVDCDARKVYVGINGTLYGRSDATTMTVVSPSDITSGTNPAYELLSGYSYFAWVNAYTSSSSGAVNFGQKPFKFPPPDGFQPLNNANTRPETVITRPDQYVGIVTFRGTGTTPQSIRGLNFNAKPDLVWIKDRDNNFSHRLADSVRGSTRVLFPDQTNDEQVNEYGTIDKFTLNGFDLRQGSNNNGDGSNTNNADLVAWTWKAGGSGSQSFYKDDVGYATASAAGLTAGTITPTGASVGTKQGFSIVKHTGTGTNGASLSHGLLQTPDFIITKNLSDGAVDWIIKPVGLLTDDSYMLIFNTNGQFQGSGGYISAQNNSTVTFTQGSNFGNYNTLDDQYIHYFWHDVPGLQKFGTFYSNGTTDNAFVELGFKPKLVFWKFRDNTGGWFLYDSERPTYTNGNPLGKYLELNSNNQEGDSTPIVDFLSNGFKTRFGFGGTPQTLVYAAWAEAPASNLYGGQSNAR